MTNEPMRSTRAQAPAGPGDVRGDGPDAAEPVTPARGAGNPPGDTTVDAPTREEPSVAARFGAALREFVVVIAMALALSFVVKTWLVQAFYIPSESMENTLVKDDRVIVNKLTPKVVDLKRGDVVVFSDPDNWLEPFPRVDHGPVLDGIRSTMIFVGLLPNPSDDHLIKRVIGMPGDHVTCCNADGRLMVNGVAIDEKAYLKPGAAPSTRRFDITVPAGRIWVMGDNRGNSEDSRFHDPSGNGSEGSVPISDVTGRAIALVWPLQRLGWLSNHEDTFATVPDASASPTPAATTTSAP